MAHSIIEWHENESEGVENESDNPMDGRFWDPVTGTEISPYEVVMRYNRMALKLEAIVTGAQVVYDIFTKVSAAVRD